MRSPSYKALASPRVGNTGVELTDLVGLALILSDVASFEKILESELNVSVFEKCLILSPLFHVMYSDSYFLLH